MKFPPPDQMRTAGYRAIDQVVDYLQSLPNLPALTAATRDQLDTPAFAIRQTPRDVLEVLDQVKTEILHFMARPAHPRFLAFVPAPGNYIGMLADFLTHGHNIFAGSWLEASGPAMIETLCIDWLRKLTGLPDSAGGVFLSGGSLANLTALTVARDRKLAPEHFHTGTVYYSDQTHICVERALRMIGIPPANLRRLPSTPDFRLDPDTLRTPIAEDRRNGLRPFCIVGNAGTTNTGAVDPLPEIAALCREENLWFHIDGAFGAAAMICDEGRARLAGLSDADSLALDPHKWLFQPFECGCVLVRNATHLLDTFHMRPEYLKDIEGSLHQPNYWDYGPELTRPFRALKLWMTLQVYGEAEVRHSVEYGMHLARIAQAHIATLPDWEIVTPAQFAILTFRYKPAAWTEEQANHHNRATGRRFTDSGFGFVISTELRGQTVLRLCTINPRTTEDDIRAVLNELNRLARSD